MEGVKPTKSSERFKGIERDENRDRGKRGKQLKGAERSQRGGTVVKDETGENG